MQTDWSRRSGNPDPITGRHPLPVPAPQPAKPPVNAAVKPSGFQADASAVVALEREVAGLRKQRANLLKALQRIATHDCGCSPCYRQCITGRAAEIELEERMELASEAITKAMELAL